MASIVLRGTVAQVVYRSDDDNFSIINLIPAETSTLDLPENKVTIKGKVANVTEGDVLEVRGDWVDDARYGRQIAIVSARVIERAANKDDSLYGVIDHITYHNQDNDYQVVQVIPDREYPDAEDANGAVTVVGIMPPLNLGESANFTGTWVENPQYGRQFKATTVIPAPPNSEAGVVRYLADKVYGVGDVTAQKIYDHFGENTMQILDDDPEQVRTVPGLKPHIAENVIKTWAEDRVQRRVMVYLQSFGISARMARRIFAHYGADTIKVLEADPYKLADEIDGIGFKTADDIARRFGIAPNAPQRLRAGLGYALDRQSTEGHVFTPREELIAEAQRLLGVDEPDLVRELLEKQVLEGALIEENLMINGQAVQAIYLPSFHKWETRVTEMLVNLTQSTSSLMFRMGNVDWGDYLADLTEAADVFLSDEQQDAVKMLMTSKLSVLTGGPGTGKTTTLRMAIDALEKERVRYKLASPTGRAAKRLTEATGKAASTIHRMLEVDMESFGFIRNEENPLEEDVIIIDESSMIDLWLFYSLLRAIKPSAHLLLVGDVDQLPSVGAGNVLNDVIHSGIAYVTRLSRIFRQPDKSHIVTNAHLINNGKTPIMTNQSDDFFFFTSGDSQEVLELVVDIVSQRLEKKIGKYDPLTDVQVIAPMYRRAVGVNALNEALQAKLNPNPDNRIAERKISGTLLRVGDKVMQTRNNYEKEVFNGDIGYIRSMDYDAGLITVNIDGKNIDYDFTDAEELIHAYCISTHRSQGSEYRIVVMPILTQHYLMLQRNLLYTAITRAKEMVVLVGEKRAVSIAVNNDKVSERYTGLLTRLLHYLNYTR